MDVVINAAMSVDGKLSSRRREQIKISGPEDFDRVDRIRADVDGVVVGIGTVLADNPHLTLDDPERRQRRRDTGRSSDPARVVVDSRGRTPPEGRICDDAAETYVLVSDAAPEERRHALREAGAELIVAGAQRVDLPMAFDQLEKRGIDRLLIEGGGELIFSVIETDLVDELTVFVGSLVIGGRDAPTLADGEGFVTNFSSLSLETVEQVDGGVVLSYIVDD
ncbi:2,5-diamino-6-(ribosylamino)-4(3H)-pyrimidinone 5'-phosphate reductase [Halohasta litchfieldiae]|jgi:2,5-diamino-6-(ribosylamino)-4(3H)-pyrimidinone 5'-phosphate reductase|uniref:2,5-diamino-6-(ribosylamino)-4(3H)-pyrimidinone 5'-phosphate reductase n=1 Tax=Halohasta litchfieldiae TaxID=1073996 RepID=A0A1H6RT59_9EURY|nr:2,5-diamino-6-(ribosylamino)-4(3H)-pyrimidinone 5'-phosphate reductase [Halohasta litchfieldiae]ATW89296.1 2,5-diamino-6-(ribosylamino)-4(3H)-pyrimidinone 5'-phosphate reductase [Halohasta litchfieldiae]SEI58941.1 2,5-diamino-6-(5-phosphoribosylamino)pyrimidin-4(3H)-one reductase [Halohasta litchfieldiae]